MEWSFNNYYNLLIPLFPMYAAIAITVINLLFPLFYFKTSTPLPNFLLLLHLRIHSVPLSRRVWILLINNSYGCWSIIIYDDIKNNHCYVVPEKG